MSQNVHHDIISIDYNNSESQRGKGYERDLNIISIQYKEIYFLLRHKNSLLTSPVFVSMLLKALFFVTVFYYIIAMTKGPLPLHIKYGKYIIITGNIKSESENNVTGIGLKSQGYGIWNYANHHNNERQSCEWLMWKLENNKENI